MKHSSNTVIGVAQSKFGSLDIVVTRVDLGAGIIKVLIKTVCAMILPMSAYKETFMAAWKIGHHC